MLRENWHWQHAGSVRPTHFTQLFSGICFWICCVSWICCLSYPTHAHDNTSTHPLMTKHQHKIMTTSITSDNNCISDGELGHMLAPLPDFNALARDIQNHETWCIGTDAMEAWHFCEFFHTSLVIVEKVWQLLERDSLVPAGCNLKQLLSAFHFMKLYLKQCTGCSTVGTSAGALDPRPTASGSGHSWRWLPICLMWWWVHDV